MSKLFETSEISGMRLVNRFVRSATCLSDNLCRGPLMQGEGIYCVVEEKKNKEKK